MKTLLVLLGSLGGAWLLWQITRELRGPVMSAQWLHEQELRDAISAGYYDGVVKFPWTDEAA